MANETPEEWLAHYGVKGMKWGVHRNRDRPGGADGKSEKKSKPTQREIYKARRSVRNDNERLYDAHTEMKKTTKRGSAERKAAEKEFAKMRLDALNNPDRVTALRVSKGEAVVLAVLGSPASAIGVGIGRAAARNKIAERQKSGYYDRKLAKKIND